MNPEEATNIQAQGVAVPIDYLKKFQDSMNKQPYITGNKQPYITGASKGPIIPLAGAGKAVTAELLSNLDVQHMTNQFKHEDEVIVCALRRDIQTYTRTLALLTYELRLREKETQPAPTEVQKEESNTHELDNRTV